MANDAIGEYKATMLRGKKIGLRARRDSDVPILHTELYDDVATPSQADFRPWRPIVAGSVHSPYATSDPADHVAHFSVVQLADDLVGEALLWQIDHHDRTAHLGLALRPAFRGRGLGIDVVRVLCHYGFLVRGLHRLQLETLTSNTAMNHAAHRAGFRLEGTLRGAAWALGDFADVAIFGLMAREFRYNVDHDQFARVTAQFSAVGQAWDGPLPRIRTVAKSIQRSADNVGEQEPGRAPGMGTLMLMSNSYSPGRAALEHAMEALAELFVGRRRVLFIPYAGSDPDRYTIAMREILAALDLRVDGAHQAADPRTALAAADAVFVGGGNAFRLLRRVQDSGLGEAIRARVRDGMPYLGVSAGANLACPTIRTTNDMPIVEPGSLGALGLVPFQINPHYPTARDGAAQVAVRDSRLGEFLEENDVPILGLREGSWLWVRDGRATLGGTAGARIFRRGADPSEIVPGDDVSHLLEVRARYDA